MSDPLPIAATDVETTGTSPTSHMAWEVAVVRRELDGTESQHLWQIRPTSAELMVADPEALEICRFEERFAVPEGAAAADMTPTLTGGDPVPLGYMDAACRGVAAVRPGGRRAPRGGPCLRASLSGLRGDPRVLALRPSCGDLEGPPGPDRLPPAPHPHHHWYAR